MFVFFKNELSNNHNKFTQIQAKKLIGKQIYHFIQFWK